MRKKILLIRTGGTIESIAKNGHGLSPSVRGSIDGRFIDNIEKRFNIEVITKRPLVEGRRKNVLKDSTEMGVEDWKRIARCLANMSNRSKHLGGAIVTHGTDTMTYAASALTFMLSKLYIPVILTGSEIPWNLQESDGPRNLANSFKAALSLDPGVFILFGSRILLGCRSVKMHSGNPEGFDSPNYPKVGEISGDSNLRMFSKIDSYNLAGRDRKIELYDHFYPDLFTIQITPDSSPDILYKVGNVPILISAYGLGNIPSRWKEVITELSTKIPIAITTQCPRGGVRTEVYDVGAPKTTISCGDMTFSCAAIKFRWAIGEHFTAKNGTLKLKSAKWNFEDAMAAVRDTVCTNYHGELTERNRLHL
ncbi:MAG: asparaginase domain-containing protein [Candidatus Micrarchaeota archaeon]|nr:asparaginase domain-containing protein [Candidatus Micrarchaeota archaeon]